MTAHYEIEKVQFFSDISVDNIDAKKNLPVYLRECVARASKKIKPKFDSIKNVIEENQTLIKEIQESVDEFRVSTQKKKQSPFGYEIIANTKGLSLQIRAIDQHISLLIRLLNNFKAHIRLKLEDSLFSMIISNMIPVYNLLGNVESMINIQLRISGEKLNYVPSLKECVDNIVDIFGNVVKDLLNSDSLVGLMQLLQPFGEFEYKSCFRSLCKHFCFC